MLQYALLHLYDFGLTIDDLKAFRVSILRPLSSFHRSNFYSVHRPSTALPPAILRLTTPPVSRSPLALLDRVSATPLVLPSPRRTLLPPSTSPVSISSTTTHTPSLVMDVSKRVLQVKPAHSLVTSSSVTSLPSGTTTISPLTVIPKSPSPRMFLSATRPTAGTL